MMPHPALSSDVPPERTCAVMAAELDALDQDILAARHRRSRRPRRWTPPDGQRVRLGGDEIAVRPVRPDDAERLRVAFGHLGALTRLRRFLVPIDHLTSHQIGYLTHVDHVDHEAILALDGRTGEGIGVARYVRDPADPRRARVAAVVVDGWQGRGVGTVLVEHLSAHARAHGIETFTGATVAGNEAARRLMLHTSVALADVAQAGERELTGRLTALPAPAGGNEAEPAPPRRATSNTPKVIHTPAGTPA